ncbi:MAG: polysaccharide biosynthesis tyrosine autokinase [Bacteroidaceae bacterium]|nr:polysaccharide biosynthesis tyrosine autokinase [Bacteroidaceae bacterium]
MIPVNNSQTNYGTQGPAPKQVSGNTLKPKDILVIALSHWYWFILSIAIALAAAYLVIRSTRPTYTRVASIMIKNDLSKNQSTTTVNGFSDAALFNTNTDVNNEVFLLSSPTMIKDVIKRLNLQQYCDVHGIFHDETLYGQSLPIEVEMENINDNDQCSFDIEMKKDSTYIMSNFMRNGQPLPSKNLTAKLRQKVKTPLGNITVKPSPYYYVHNMVITVNHETLQNTLNDVTTRLNVETASDNSTIINLNYEDVQPQRAEEILATLIAVYNESWVKDRNQITVSTNEFIKDRLAAIEDELGNVEDKIATYKTEHLIATSAEDASSLYMGQANEASNQLTNLNNQLYMSRYVRGYLTNDNNKNQLIPANQGIDNADLSSQISEYNSTLMRRNTLVSASSEQNPLVQDLDVKLNEMRNALVFSVDNHIAGLNTQMSGTRSIQGKSIARLAAAPGQSKYLLSVERQQAVKENLYMYLLQKREENELNQAFTAYNNRVVSAPSGSNEPTAPVKSKIYIIALVIGLAVPAIILFLRETMNNAVRGRKDLEELSIPFIGEIPLAQGTKKFKDKFKNIRWNPFKKRKFVEDKTLHILVKEKSRNVINEAFRVVRTNLEFMSARGEKGNIIMLTSFNPNSGKTFVATNLITSFAIKNKKVLAIDLDLRKSSLSAMVDKPKQGISDYLTGMIKNVDDVIVKGKTHPNLDIIPVGTIPPNPTELLSEKTLEDVLKELSTKYDYVFLDCPPVEIVADATIVGRHVDMTMFIIRADLMDRALLPEVQKYYEDGRLPKMSMILNGTSDAFSYYGYHRYGSRYGYHYSYGSSYGGYTQK